MTSRIPAPHLVGAVAVGGAAGAILRWSITEAFPGAVDAFPWSTFAVNVAGSFLLALLPALAAVRRHRALAVGLGPGLLGGFTTLSSYSEQTRALLDHDRTGLAAAYVLGTLAVCLVAVAVADHWSTLAQRAAFEAEGGDEWTVLLVGLGAAVGAPLRFLLSGRFDGHWHRGTLAANVVGSWLLGLFSALALSDHTGALLGVGLCGGLTTYSSFAVQTHGLGPRRGAAYAAVTILVALAACGLGFWVGGALSG